jgi:hypothetical protein
MPIMKCNIMSVGVGTHWLRLKSDFLSIAALVPSGYRQRRPLPAARRCRAGLEIEVIPTEKFFFNHEKTRKGASFFIGLLF